MQDQIDFKNSNKLSYSDSISNAFLGLFINSESSPGNSISFPITGSISFLNFTGWAVSKKYLSHPDERKDSFSMPCKPLLRECRVNNYCFHKPL